MSKTFTRFLRSREPALFADLLWYLVAFLCFAALGLVIYLTENSRLKIGLAALCALFTLKCAAREIEYIHELYIEETELQKRD